MDDLVSSEKLDAKDQGQDEEKASKELLAEVQKRKNQLEDEMWQELDKYIFTWEAGKRRSKALNAQIWRPVQSSNTKAENLEHDFHEIVSKKKKKNDRWAGVMVSG